MASSVATRAARRAGEHKAVIEGLLKAGESKAALNEAIRALQSESKWLRENRPADGVLTDAELAGSILAIAAGLYAYKPERPVGCRRTPDPADLLVIFEAQLPEGKESHG